MAFGTDESVLFMKVSSIQGYSYRERFHCIEVYNVINMKVSSIHGCPDRDVSTLVMGYNSQLGMDQGNERPEQEDEVV